MKGYVRQSESVKLLIRFVEEPSGMKATDVYELAELPEGVCEATIADRDGLLHRVRFPMAAVESWMVKGDPEQARYQFGVKVENPPARALFFMALFIAPEMRESVLGDAEERYMSDKQRFGTLGATRLLWWDVARTATAWVSRTALAPLVRVAASFTRLGS